MTPADLSSLRATLEAQLAELKHPVLSDELTVERESDVLSNAQQYQARDLAGVLTTRRTAKIRQIEAALERMERNEYGICEDCSEPIPLKRLNAVPWATVCVPCQELRDREGVRDAA